jgi:hypothetical protein
MMRFSRSFRIALVSLLLGIVGAEAQTNTRNQPNTWAAPQAFNSGELILGGSGVASNCAAFNSSSALIGQACPSAGTPTDVVAFAPLSKASTAAIFAAGSGYNTSDTITVATTGGTCSIAPVLTVTASGGGSHHGAFRHDGGQLRGHSSQQSRHTREHVRLRHGRNLRDNLGRDQSDLHADQRHEGRQGVRTRPRRRRRQRRATGGVHGRQRRRWRRWRRLDEWNVYCSPDWRFTDDNPRSRRQRRNPTDDQYDCGW